MEPCRRLMDAWKRGEMETVARLQRIFMEFPARWMRYGLAAVMKVAMEAVGVPLGNPYPPFGVVSPADREAILAYVRQEAAFHPTN